MASRTSPNASLLPWIWAVEALASNQTDSSVLIDLVKKIPVVLSESDGKSARELACLRILESLSVLEKGKSSDVLHKFDSGVGFSISDCCQDVLGQLLSESCGEKLNLTETDKSKADLKRPLVKHRRHNLPKCGLKELKAAILKDNNLLPSSVIERSGLLIKNDSDGITTRRKGSNCDALENPPVRGLSSGKTIMNDSATANQEGSSACKQLIVYNAYPNFNAAMKRKHDALSTHKTVEGKHSASFHERRDVEDMSRDIDWHSDRNESDLPEEPHVKYSKETNSSGNVASKKLKTNSTVDDAGHLNNPVQATCSVLKMARDTSGEEHISNIISHEAKKDGENTVELRTSGSSVELVTQETRYVDEAKGNCEHSYLLTTNSVCSGEAIPSKELDHHPDKSSNDDTHYNGNADIIIRRDAFLNSQDSPSQDSLATVNGTTQLCMICRIGGGLLVCSSGSCRRVVHKRCMGVSPTFDALRNFLCPFCVYSHAISEYSESKKKASLARKALLAFISRDEYRLRNVSPISLRTDQVYLRESEVSDKHDEQKSLGDGVSRDNETQSKIQEKDKPLVCFDTSCGGRERALHCGGNAIALEEKQNAERSSSSLCCQSQKEQQKQVPVLSVRNGGADIPLHKANDQPSAVEKLLELIQPNGANLMSNKDEQNIASQAVQVSKVCKDMEITHGREQHDGTEREQNVSNEPHVFPSEHAKPPHSDVSESSGEKDNSISLRVRKREQQHAYLSIPQLRRKKVPWSNAEEETLKEGVRRFADNHNRVMPWKKILEFGADIFEKNRTTIDLKDKWRNICKGSNKTKV